MNEEVNNIHTDSNIHAETAVAAHGEHAESAHEGGLLTINGTLFVIMASFIVFTFVMQWVLYGPLNDIRRKRLDYILKNKTGAEEAIIEAENLAKDYQAKIKEAQKQSTENTTEILNETNAEKNRILEAKKQDVNSFVSGQKQIILEEKNHAIDTLKDQIAGYARNISGIILGEEIPMAGLTPEVIEKALNRQ